MGIADSWLVSVGRGFVLWPFQLDASSYNSTMISRFFCPEPLRVGAIAVLPEAIAHHAVRVLRLGIGDRLVLFDGAGGEYRGHIVAAGRRVEVALDGFDADERESALALTLVQALPAADKMDWVVQKAVELGVTRIVPVASRRSVVKLSGERAARRVEHWRQVAVAACEQCGRNRLPEVEDIVDLPHFLAREGGSSRFILAPGGTARLAALPVQQAAQLMVGPEGGWEEDEVAAARSTGWQPLALGPRTLRTETAGLAALAAMQAMWGDL